jgi:membrane protease YdiL (CAAX protease family)
MHDQQSLSIVVPLFINIAAVGLGVLALRKWARNHVPAAARWKRLGLDFQAAGVTEFAIGFVIGTSAMVGVFLVEGLTGLLQVSDLQLPVVGILKRGGILAAAAALEELLFRGFMINGILTVRRSVWFAVAASALLFGVAHVANPNGTALGAVSTMIGGIMYALAYLWSGRLWMPWGLHLAWNFIQGPVLGFPVSGFKWESIVQQMDVGPVLLTGGDYGPEGGLVGIAFRLVVILLLILWRYRSPRTDRPEPWAIPDE